MARQGRESAASWCRRLGLARAALPGLRHRGVAPRIARLFAAFIDQTLDALVEHQAPAPDRKRLQDAVADQAFDGGRVTSRMRPVLGMVAARTGSSAVIKSSHQWPDRDRIGAIGRCARWVAQLWDNFRTNKHRVSAEIPYFSGGARVLAMRAMISVTLFTPRP